LNNHAGQISFPGGRIDKEDATPWETAIRETEEETGIDLSSIKYLTKLTNLYIPPSNFDVNVYVGCIYDLPKLKPNIDEVDDLLCIPISHFMDVNNIKDFEFEVLEGNLKTAPAYEFNEHIIWGASAMMLSEFVSMIKKMPAM
jgi:8-oxo-dGTP pyrophosphatase MutT (NUDIX family)